MKKTITLARFTVLIPLLFLVQVGSAQPVPLSVQAAVAAALDHHGSVRIAEQKVRAAEARADEAGTHLLPTLQVTGRAFLLSDVEQGQVTVPVLPGSPSFSLFETIPHSYGARLHVTQPIFTGFRLSNAKDAAMLGADAARADRMQRSSTIQLRVEVAYWAWVQAVEAKKVLDGMVGQMKQHEERVQHLLENGVARQSDVLNIRVRRSEMEVRAIQAGTAASLAMMRLNSLIGNDLKTELVPEDDPLLLASDDIPRDANRLTEIAIGTRSDLAAAHLRTEMARSGVAIAEAGWYPNISVAAAVDYANPNQRIIPPQDKFDATWEVGVMFQWTIWDWMRTGSRTDQAVAVQRQAEEGYTLMLDAARLEVAQYVRKVSDSHERLTSARLALEAAEESFRITEEENDKGVATVIDVTDARMEVLRASLTVQAAATEAVIARAELRHAVGEMPQ